MSIKPKRRDRRGSFQGGSRRSSHFRRPDRPQPPCGICGEVIKDITSALSRPKDQEPVHFDCAIQSAREELRPIEGEIVIYLGNGGFAVVEKQAYEQRKLKVLRRINWENQEENKSEWQLQLRTEVH